MPARLVLVVPQNLCVMTYPATEVFAVNNLGSGNSVTVSLGSDLKFTTSMYSVYLRLIFKPTDGASCSTVVSRACASVWSRESKAVSSASVCDGVPTCGLIVSHECCLVWHVLKCSQVPASMVPECLLVVPRH